MIRVALPAHLRTLGGISCEEVILEIDGPVTQRAILDALEAAHPAVRGAIRDHATHVRRPFLRFFAGGQDLSLDSPDALLPEDVAAGAEPFLVVAAIAGG
jgi:hypothetical protein